MDFVRALEKEFLGLSSQQEQQKSKQEGLFKELEDSKRKLIEVESKMRAVRNVMAYYH